MLLPLDIHVKALYSIHHKQAMIVFANLYICLLSRFIVGRTFCLQNLVAASL